MSDDPITDTQPERAPRHSVMLSAVVERFGGGGPTKHRIRDLSAAGVRIDQAMGISVGATVLISVGRLEAVGATVVWVKDDLAGLKFVQPIDLDDARAKAVIASISTGAQPRDQIRAGWIRDLSSPYRK